MEAFHCWLESAKLEDEKTLQKIDATTTDATDCKRCSRDEKLPFARLYHFPAPASLSQSSNENHDQTRSASLGSHQREISSSSSEYSMSPHREGSRSPDLTTPRSGPDSSENSSIASSSSPRLRTSSLAPPQSYSGERTHSALSSTERTQRTPLPTKKGPNSTRNPSEAMQEKELETHRAPVIRGLSYAESAISPRERSVDLPVDISLKRKSLSPRVVSSEPIHVDSSQTKILSVAGNYSRYRSPSATSSCDNVGTDASTRSRTRSSSSMVLSPDYPGTPPRKRAALEEARMQGSMTEGTASAPYTTLSPNFTPTTSESIDQNQNARNKLVKRRGRKPANINTAEHCHLNDSPSVTSSSDQISLSNNLKRDNIKDRPPRQLPPLDHTPRIILQNQDPSQPYAKISPTKQSENIPPQPHRILPPRPSITPPPGSSAQPLQKYRPPAVVFTIDNRAESRMLTADVQSFIEQFTKNARVVAPSTQPSTSSYIYPISVIMWQSLSDFYKWYTEATGSTAIGPLRFELVDVQWQTEKAFVIPEGNLNDFRILKQYVWDLFWVASNLNNGLSLFQVSISSFPSRGVDVLSTPSSWHPVNSTSPPPRTSGTGSLENIMVVAEPRTLLASKSSPRLAPHSPAISTSTSRTSNIKHILNSKEVKEVKGRAGRRTTVPPSNQSAGKSSIDASSSNRVPRPSDYIHGPPGPPFNTHRTSWDKASLCDRAHAYVRYPQPIYNHATILTILEAGWKE